MPDGFTFEIQSSGNRALLTAFGELDLASCSRLETALAELADCDSLVIDLSKLEFIDSTGLGVLVRTHNSWQQAGKQIALVEGNGQVRRLLQLTGLADRLQLIDQAPNLTES